MKPVKMLGTQHLAGSDTGRSVSLLCGYHANLFTSEAKLFWRTTDTSSKMESEMNLGPFSFSGCVSSVQFHVGTFNHYSP